MPAPRSELIVVVVKVAAGVDEDPAVYKLTVFPGLPADHQNPTYFTGAANVSVRFDPTGPTTNLDGVPPAVGVSDVVEAPPHTYAPPLVIMLHVPENVPTALAGKELQSVKDSKSSRAAPYELGGPWTNGGDTYAVMPSPAAAMTGRVCFGPTPETIDRDPSNAPRITDMVTRLIR